MAAAARRRAVLPLDHDPESCRVPAALLKPGDKWDVHLAISSIILIVRIGRHLLSYRAFRGQFSHFFAFSLCAGLLNESPRFVVFASSLNIQNVRDRLQVRRLPPPAPRPYHAPRAGVDLRRTVATLSAAVLFCGSSQIECRLLLVSIMVAKSPGYDTSALCDRLRRECPRAATEMRVTFFSVSGRRG